MVDCNFMYASLKRFGFGKYFVQWIETLFKNSHSCVMNNGTSTTGYFSLERETRHCDPISLYFFILILFIQVRSDSSMKGFGLKKLK